MDKELIVEGLDVEDFILLEKILSTYKVSINDEITYTSLVLLYNKVKQIVTYVQT